MNMRFKPTGHQNERVIDLELEEVYIYSGTCGRENIYATLTFAQIEEIYKQIRRKHHEI